MRGFLFCGFNNPEFVVRADWADIAASPCVLIQERWLSQRHVVRGQQI